MMSGKSEKDKLKREQERYQVILARLLREEDNKYCADCDGKGPRWASWNLGIFLCIRCAGIHRNLGVHISRVKSVNLDSWTAEQIESMEVMGNQKAREIYEYLIPESHRRPQSDSSLEHFIRSKYEKKQWINKTYTFSSKSKEKHREDKKRKKPFDMKHVPSVPLSQEIKNQVSADNNLIHSNTEINVPTFVETSNNDMGQLEVNLPKNSIAVFGKEDSFPQCSELVGLDLSVGLSSSPEQNLLGEDLIENNASTKGKSSMTKDSIMALYGSVNQNQTVYGVPGGHYMKQQYQQNQHVQHFGMQPPPRAPNPSMQISYNKSQHSSTLPINQFGIMSQPPQKQINQIYPISTNDNNPQQASINPSTEMVASNNSWTSITSGHTLSNQLWK